MTSILRVDSIQTAAGGSATASGLGIGGVGKIGQVLQAYKTDIFTTTASGLNDVTGLTVSITPSSTSSKVLVTSFVSGFSHSGRGGGFRLVRDSTSIGLHNTASNRTLSSFSGHLYTGDASGTAQMHFNAQAMYLDSPSTTSATTYKVQCNGTGAALYINRQETDTDDNDHTRCVSHITVMEVLA